MELQQNTVVSRPCRKAFCIALLTASVIFIPFMIWDKGYFFFFGDFNVQQIPFYKLAHEAVRSGTIFWNWYTDLGANFIGSYSFYLIGSPFFWLTLPFPTEFVPHLMAPLFILKHACAAFTGTLYIRRFVRTPNYAVLGGLLYAFSGFTVYNIFFNHFHEAIICFPLLLVGLEELIVNDRRGLFALSVAVNAFINYWFFIGEVVFVILYFIIRSLSPDWKMSFRKFFWTAFESVVGVLLSMCLLLPSVLAIMGNPRTGITELLDGWNFWLYWHCQLYPAIGASAFFPPDLPSRPNLFPDRGAKWASLSAWLPFFSMSGVIAYLQCKRDWLRRILLISFLFALVPGLNSLFVLFNGSYYARWYYMPVLLMALATIRALENRSIDLNRGYRWTMIITAATSAILAFTPIIDSAGKVTWGLTKYPDRFLAIAAIALAGLIALGILLYRYRESKLFFRMLCSCLCFIIVAYTGTFIGMGKTHSDDTDFIRDVALKGRYQLQLPDGDTFARSDIYKGMDNLGMYWHLPNIQAFHSIIPVSIMDFYPKVGVKRDVSSKPETKYYQLRPLLSVRWLFVKEDEEDQDLMPGWELQSTQLGYNIYENQNFIPMGFTYDYYINERDFEKITEERRAAVLLRALILPDEDSLDYVDILEKMPKDYYESLGQEDYETDCENRRATAGDSFVIDKRGFTSEINLPRENLVFYSVPFDKGWSATVNGEPAKIQKVSIGFMAVRAPEGRNTIRFTYTPPGLYTGIAASIAGLVLLAAYLLFWKRFGKAVPVKERQVEGEESDVFHPEEEPQAEWLEPSDAEYDDELPKPPEAWFETPDASENEDQP